jgi:hypothetical protein
LKEIECISAGNSLQGDMETVDEYHNISSTLPPLIIDAWEAVPEGTLKEVLFNGDSIHTAQLLTMPTTNALVHTVDGHKFQLREHKSAKKQTQLFTKAQKRRVC